MKISLIIPVYNEEKYIESCLKSIMAQKEKPDEILVIDNNCTDKTIEIAQRFSAVRIVKESIQGMIPARNRGFDEAQYEIIARCDADVILPPDWIGKMKQAFQQYNMGGYSGPIIFYDLPIKTPFFALLFSFIMRALRKGQDIIVGPNMAITKLAWEKIKNEVCMDDSKVHEDIDLSIHLNQKNIPVRFDKNFWVYASGRRIKHNPLSFFIEYPIRLIKTILKHKNN